MKKENNIPKITFVTRKLLVNHESTNIFVITNIQKFSFTDFLHTCKKMQNIFEDSDFYLASKLN